MTEQTKKGRLFIISAPSGAGKSTLINKLLNSSFKSKYYLSISHTTRPVRPGEVHGVHYYFTNIENFEHLIQQDEFLEYAEVFGNYYGTSKRIIREKLDQGINILLDIDWQGARNVRKQFPEAISIFILPPSLEELQKRLLNRQTDSLDVIARRMEKAENEMAHKDEYNYEILNDDLDHAFKQFVDILESSSK
ncbi:guanylate kinase [Psittacicella hinzii]|uniref:Guanylate kinase n=1 Tax=Psittacicella hinzii TaxID=2028575 RepID=A0A3A1Y694_9GAMM|nr:guanylate kinase [Psittacicella hinzii]RIY33783.1 guanylate kinase [Psittacicella hinzii]